MLNSGIITLGKLFSKTTQVLNLGHGSTWPGHIALSLNTHFVRDLINKNSLKTIIIAGTNGKTTTSALLRTIFEKDGKKVLQNHSGANLLNGIASTLLLSANLDGKLSEKVAVFEVDENTLPALLQQMTPDAIVLLNLFRDQLDRYGEVNTIAQKWKTAFTHLDEKTHLYLNADDPLIAYLGEGQKKVTYFGLSEKGLQDVHDHAVDSVYCPKCGERLRYTAMYFSHLGDWECPSCKLKKPVVKPFQKIESPLLGQYNEYNIQAASLVAQQFDVSSTTIMQAVASFQPAFGRQEVLEMNGKKIQLFLSKNPTGFNASLRAITDAKAQHVLFVLNDRIPDGRDISWIWDVDFENLTTSFSNITVSGDRCYDMALRLKYAEKKSDVFTDLSHAIKEALDKTPEKETLFVLPTYSAMLETRKVITGKKIL